MKLGLHLYSVQLAPGSSASGVAPVRAASDVYQLVRESERLDFLLIGGAPPACSLQRDRSAGLIVPFAAAALTMIVPGVEIVTKLSAWGFDPAHVARIGANLDRLSGGRWSLYLGSEADGWAEEDASDAEKHPDRTREFLDIVLQHWAGTARFAGRELQSTGRMVGPRPEGTRPKIMMDISALDACRESGGVAADCAVVTYNADVTCRAGTETLVTCPVVLGRSSAEAQSFAQEIGLRQSDRCIVGDADTVVREILELSRRQPARVAVGFPAMRAEEYRLFRESVLPKLSTAAA